MNKRYIFLIKGSVITQLCDDEPYSELIRDQLLRQGFYISHLHIYASNDALAYQKYIEHYSERKIA